MNPLRWPMIRTARGFIHEMRIYARIARITRRPIEATCVFQLHRLLMRHAPREARRLQAIYRGEA